MSRKKLNRKTGWHLSLPAFRKLREDYERDNFGGGMIRMAESCHAASASVKMAFKKKPWVLIIKIEKR